jgi:hypothetical protein
MEWLVQAGGNPMEIPEGSGAGDRPERAAPVKVSTTMDVAGERFRPGGAQRSCRMPALQRPVSRFRSYGAGQAERFAR